MIHYFKVNNAITRVLISISKTIDYIFSNILRKLPKFLKFFIKINHKYKDIRYELA